MVTSLLWRSAIVGLSQSLTPASSSLRGVFFGFKGAMVNRAQGTEGIWGIQCLLRSDWSLRWLDVCICTDASEKGFVFAVREGCHELASEVGRVSERTSCKRSARSIRARSLCASLHGTGVLFGVFKFGRGCDIACPKGVSRGLHATVVATLIPRNGDWRRTVVSRARKTS